ncbi:MAG: glycoside hydrolase family 43 protein [Polyangia bacterium]
MWAGLPLLAALLRPTVGYADNPIVQTNYTADPAPMIYDGVAYVFTGHDEDATVNGFFTMNDWRAYSSTDMVNWTDHGSPMSYHTFGWARGDAWAAQPIFRNGKFYYYAPVTVSASGSMGIGVGVSDSPTGPYKDAIGKPLVTSDCGDIDPSPFIDDDGQAYLYWGNPKSCYVKLNQDMVSYSGSVNHSSMTTSAFGSRPTAKANYPTLYEEGPFFFKRNSLYYLVYASDCCSPEKIDYSTSSTATGPWTHRGRIYTSAGSASFTNQTGIFDYKGHSYALYHNGALPGGGGYKRSVCIEEFKYNADGTIPTITPTALGPAPIANLNPFVQTEAETMAFSSGLKTEVCGEGGIDVTSINNGDYIKVRSVNFGSGITSFAARVAASGNGGMIELHLDSQTGPTIATCAVTGTGGNQTWMTTTCTASGATGVHDLFLKFTGSGSGTLFNFNWWKFSGPGASDNSPDGGTTPATGGAGGAGRGGASGAGGAKAGTSGAGGAPSGSGGMVTGSGGAPVTGTGGVGSGGQAVTTGGTGGGSPAARDVASGCSCQSGPDGALGWWSTGGVLALAALRLRRRPRSAPVRTA